MKKETHYLELDGLKASLMVIEEPQWIILRCEVPAGPHPETGEKFQSWTDGILEKYRLDPRRLMLTIVKGDEVAMLMFGPGYP